ncbi:MAG: hypothetical protein RJA99_3210 [Pseudomonadota bacterium]|jgi:hypothetical protein
MTHASTTLAPGHVANFKAMLRAALNKDLALIQCTDAKTGEPVPTICMVNKDAEGNVEFMPVARMFNTNPYQELLPPSI